MRRGEHVIQRFARWRYGPLVAGLAGWAALFAVPALATCAAAWAGLIPWESAPAPAPYCGPLR